MLATVLELLKRTALARIIDASTLEEREKWLRNVVLGHLPESRYRRFRNHRRFLGVALGLYHCNFGGTATANSAYFLKVASQISKPQVGHTEASVVPVGTALPYPWEIAQPVLSKKAGPFCAG